MLISSWMCDMSKKKFWGSSPGQRHAKCLLGISCRIERFEWVGPREPKCKGKIGRYVCVNGDSVTRGQIGLIETSKEVVVEKLHYIYMVKVIFWGRYSRYRSPLVSLYVHFFLLWISFVKILVPRNLIPYKPLVNIIVKSVK